MKHSASAARSLRSSKIKPYDSVKELKNAASNNNLSSMAYPEDDQLFFRANSIIEKDETEVFAEALSRRKDEQNQSPMKSFKASAFNS